MLVQKILADNKLELMDKYVVEVQLERLEKGKIRNQKTFLKQKIMLKKLNKYLKIKIYLNHLKKKQLQ